MKEFFIDSDGTRIHAKLERPEGAEKGPLCILVHGFTGHMEEDHIIAANRLFSTVAFPYFVPRCTATAKATEYSRITLFSNG